MILTLTGLVQSLTLVILGGVVIFQILTVRYLGKRIDILAEVLTNLLNIWTEIAATEKRRRMREEN